VSPGVQSVEYYQHLDIEMDSSSFKINLNAANTSIEFRFFTHFPEYSSTYTLTDEVFFTSDDPLLESGVEYSPNNLPPNAYILKESAGNQEISITREKDKIYFTFCNIVFERTNAPENTVTLSGKVKFNI
jgi:hypothetical protein